MNTEKKWLATVESIGSIYRDSYNELKKKGMEKSLGKVMYGKGLKAGREMKREMKLKGSLRDCARALIKMYEPFHIKGKVVKEGKGEVRIGINGCLWGSLEGWKPEHCVSIEEYEKGILDAIRPNVIHGCPKRKSMGKKECELVLRDRE